MTTYANDVEAVKAFNTKYNQLTTEIGKVIYGQEHIVKDVIISIFSGGHCLLVGVPGLAKTLLVNTIAQTLGLKFNRIQFTPDLMPSDIIGSEILDENRSFKFIQGPIFSNVILADEINRTPPKTQAALLEAMQEKQITAGGKLYKLDNPFFVIATQNPIEQEGTYPLPEAQLDRFMFSLYLDYPTLQDELKIAKNTTQNTTVELQHVLTSAEIIEFQELVRRVPVTDNVLEYAVTLVNKTRPNGDLAPTFIKDYISWGAGPRASQYLILGAKCHAVLNGKYSPDIEDVKAVAINVLRHRMVKNYKAEADGLSIESIVKQLL
ncbi:MAG: MoxR family ATPase [Bacteroidia bacterium]|nr:MoxR family ATPase [Bacteroidia bacterium]